MVLFVSPIVVAGAKVTGSSVVGAGVVVVEAGAGVVVVVTTGVVVVTTGVVVVALTEVKFSKLKKFTR